MIRVVMIHLMIRRLARIVSYQIRSKDFAVVAPDADGHGAGLPVDPTVQWVLVDGEAHEVSAS
jgi:hypothetical protein